MVKFMKKTAASFRRFFAGFENRRLSNNFIILMVVCISLVIVSVFVYLNQPTDLDRLNNTYLDIVQDPQKISEGVVTNIQDEYELKDFTIYGENLIFYAEPYSPESDDLLGKNVVLRNVETGQETFYTFDSAIDSGISLGTLDEGIYEIYVYDHYLRKRVYFADTLYSEPFYTMRRDGRVKNVQIVADRDYLKNYKVEFDKNYAFLTVISQMPKIKVVDIILDPSGNVYNDYANSLDTGMGNSRIMETETSMQLALKVKEHLEKAGLRVRLSREGDETSGYYGTDSRAGKGYASSAKVFLNLSMLNDENTLYNRPYMMISPLTKSSLANHVAYYMMENGLELTNAVAEEMLEQGVTYDGYVQKEDGSFTHFSQFPQLRETGGKATFAGESDISTANQQYEDAYGMYGIMFRYCNLANDDSITYYLDHEDEIARLLANGILDFYGIEAVINETAGE